MKFDEELLGGLYQDLNACRLYIKQVAQGMLKGMVTKYPIFVALRSQLDIDIGLPIINRAELDITWSFNASHLEDFVISNIIHDDKVDEFKKNYKNPDEYMCVFIAEEGMMSFVFMPYDKPTGGLDVSKEQLN